MWRSIVSGFTDAATERLALVVGDEGLARLAKARVMVLGLGGVGSSCAEALARGGVGALTLIDRDVIEASNINRQALAFMSTIGHEKAGIMAAMVREINPKCDICAQRVFLDKECISKQLAAFPRPDYVIDAIDTISQKLRIAAWCQEQGIREISAMGGANKLDPSRLRFAPIEKTKIDPIARVMRKECRRRGIRGLTVLFSDEIPREPEGKKEALGEGGFVREGCSILGTMSYYPPIMGQMIAGYVIREIVGLA